MVPVEAIPVCLLKFLSNKLLDPEDPDKKVRYGMFRYPRIC